MSFFVADNKISIKQESIAIPSINGLNYNPGQLIELKIDPSQIKFFDPKNSYLQFNVKLQMPTEASGAVAKFMLDSHIGAQALIKDIRIHDGNNNALLEEIVGYNIATMLKYDYHCNDSLRNKRALSEGAGGRITPHGQLGTRQSWQNSHKQGFTVPDDDGETRTGLLKNASYCNVKVCLPLNTGIFQNDKVFPSMLTNGLRIQILLEDADKVCRMCEGVMLNRKKRLNPFFHSSNGCLTSTGAGGAMVNGTDYTTIFLTQDNGYLDPASVPFAVGERIAIVLASTGVEVASVPNITISKIEFVSGFNLIKLTTNAFTPGTTINTVANASHLLISKSVEGQSSYNMTYSVKDVNIVLQSLDMGSQYEADMLRRMREGGTINYDFLSMTNYRYSQLASDLVAQIQLPIENRRMKSVICVPTDSSVYTNKQILQASGTYEVVSGEFQDRCGLVGISDNIQSYQFTYDGRLQPSRLVDCSKTSSKTSVSQQHLIELEKALTAGGISGQSMLEFNNNFVLGRSVAVQGGVYDARNRQFSLNVNYTGASAPGKNKLWNNFVFHIRRMTIAGDTISVEV
tara:strand:+ start:2050 stop:3768 length:1719 start_codon:yes stop_codon:yes gene_type:complete